MQKTAKTRREATEKVMSPALAVSKKFYDYIISRIHYAVAAVGGSVELCAGMTAAVDLYLADGTLPGADARAEIMLMFALLRPEIDKAVARSRAARERARKRHASTRRMERKNASLVPSADESEVPRLMNRSERRRAERERQRLMRREARDMAVRR